jgi:hypothetical protein
MPTRTQPRRAAGSSGGTGRFQRRQQQSTSRFQRRQPQSTSRFAARPARPTDGRKGTTQRFGGRPMMRSKKRRQQQGGITGMVSGALSSLTGGGRSKTKAKRKAGQGGRSKSKSAFALLAAGAGAIMGGRQLRKHRHSDAGPGTTATYPTVPPPSAPPSAP